MSVHAGEGLSGRFVPVAARVSGIVRRARRAQRMMRPALPQLTHKHTRRSIPGSIEVDAPVLIVSPHLDDAVLSAFAFLAERRATVLTVFTGSPGGDEPSHWDRDLGHTDGGAIMRVRLDEDTRALESLQVDTIRLGLLENGYRSGVISDVDLSTMRDAVRGWVTATSGKGVVLAPAGAGAVDNRLYRLRFNATVPLLRVPGGGLPHPDHLIVRDTIVAEALSAGGRVAIYEELPYRWTGRGDRHVARLASALGTRATRFHVDVDVAAKATAVGTYASQTPGLFRPWVGDIAAVMPRVERYWLLERA